jgi:hypothetical protein
MNYGAKGDGTTNDLAALQAAVDAADAAGGGTVWLGPGVFNIGTGTWKIGNANTQHYVNVSGINMTTSKIVCDTSAGGAAIYLNQEKFVTLKEFSIINEGVRGGYGIQLGGDGGVGTQTSGSIVQHLFFQNFWYGVFTSGGIGTSSEIEFDHCVFQLNAYGFYSANFNAVNFLFHMLEIYDNVIAGLYVSTGNATVIGGASSNNGNDFYIAGGNDGTVKIVGFRAETPVGDWLVSNADNYLSIEDCIIHPRATGVEVIHAPGELSIRNSQLGGYITWGGFEGSALTLDNVWVNTPGNDWSFGNQYSHASNPPFGPAFRMTNDTGIQLDARVHIRNVYEGSTGLNVPDLDGVMGVRPSDNMRVCLVSD